MNHHLLFKLMQWLSILFCLLAMACQDSKSDKQNSQNNDKPPQVIKETSPRARFEQFIAQFPSLQLPYTLNPNTNFKRLDELLVERVLGVAKDPELGLKSSIYCIGSFKVHDFIAVLYQSTPRPNTQHAPTDIKIALYTPYGALKEVAILGQNQQTEAFNERINLLISANFTIQVSHDIDAYVPLNKQLNSYHSFYTKEYKLSQAGEIQFTKDAALWEKIPEEFLAPFVLEQKKTPASSKVSIESATQRTRIKSYQNGYGQIIVQRILDSLIFVSSLEMQPTETATDSFYVNSKVALIQFKNKHLKILSSQFVPSSTWASVYQAIQKNCRCAPAPAANENGIINLTELETPLLNAVFADFNSQKQAIEFICNQGKKNADTSFYAIPIKY